MRHSSLAVGHKQSVSNKLGKAEGQFHFHSLGATPRLRTFPVPTCWGDVPVQPVGSTPSPHFLPDRIPTTNRKQLKAVSNLMTCSSIHLPPPRVGQLPPQQQGCPGPLSQQPSSLPEPVVLKMQFPVQQAQHHLGTCSRCTFSGATPDLHVPEPASGSLMPTQV